MMRRPETSEPEDVGPRGFDDYELRLGDIMRGERATKGKSLLDVQRDIKIKAEYLAGIEDADLSEIGDAMPGLGMIGLFVGFGLLWLGFLAIFLLLG